MKLRNELGCPENWASELDKMMLLSRTDTPRPKAYICSPCRAESRNGVYGNMMAARYYMFYAYNNMSVYPFAPYAYLPVMLNDKNPDERAFALKFGLELLSIVDMVIVCGNQLTDGMRGEILRAVELGIIVITLAANVYENIKKITNDELIQFCDKHTQLSLNAKQIFQEELL